MRNFPQLVFHVEPADRSVGIMSEDFSAWEHNGKSWCHLEDAELTPKGMSYKFNWFETESGEPITPPTNAYIVEKFLAVCYDMYYNVVQ